MQVSYKRSMNQNYIILQQEGMTDPKGYQTAILLENTVPGLLPCRIQRVNGEALFYYDITGYQSIQSLYECSKMGEKDLAQLLLCTGEITEELGEYLLNSDSLLMEAKYIYKNKETEKISFLYFPYYTRETGLQFQELLEYLLPKIDYEDKRAVTMGYGIYKAAANGCVTREVIKGFVHSGQEKEEKKNFYEICQEEVEAEEQQEKRKRILDEFYKEDEEENQERIRLPILIGGIFLLACLLFLLWHSRVISLGAVLVTGIVVCLLFSGGTVWILLREKQMEKQKETMDREQKRQAAKETDEGLIREDREGTAPEIKSGTAGKNHYGTEKGNRKDEDWDLTVLLSSDEEEESACLEQLDSPEPKKFSLKKDITFVGKWKQMVDLWIDDPTVSRTHARIVRKETGDYITDLNSRNGTCLNQEYLNPEQEYMLKNGDIIQFSRVQFRYSKSHERK